jgi:cobalt-zinc-cadmium efflux system protein
MNRANGCKEHDHAAHAPPASQSRLFWALLLTVGCLLAEAIGGAVAGSLALLADAAHMLTDAAALAMGYAAVRAALRPATQRLSYGHHRWQVLAAFVNGAALLLLAAWILYEAAQRLRARPGVNGGVVAGVAVLGLAANLGAFAVLSGGAGNLGVRAALAHVSGDIAGSGAALLAGLVLLGTGWLPIDPLLSAVVAALMIHSGWKIVRESAHILLEGAPPGLDRAHIEPLLRSAVPQLLDIHHLHSWSLADEQPMVTLHAAIRGGADADQCIQDITRVLRQQLNVRHATIQIEHGSCGTARSCELDAGSAHARPAAHPTVADRLNQR